MHTPGVQLPVPQPSPAVVQLCDPGSDCWERAGKSLTGRLSSSHGSHPQGPQPWCLHLLQSSCACAWPCTSLLHTRVLPHSSKFSWPSLITWLTAHWHSGPVSSCIQVLQGCTLIVETPPCPSCCFPDYPPMVSIIQLPAVAACSITPVNGGHSGEGIAKP